ncbi:hypothetical protein ACS0TY_013680 [Phlomoides rotata]
MKRDTMEQMYELYYNHARALGFSVRKSTCRYSRDAVPIELAKLFVCSCNGEKLKRSDSSSTDTSTRKKNTIVTRTNCLAMMRAKRTDDGIYVVVKHETNHNHTMTREEWSYFHRSEREIIDEKARAIEDMTSSGMRATESFRYLAHNVGGEENVGHTMKDHINFVNRLKSNIIEAGDAETVFDMLQDQEVEENDFFYKIKMDDEGRLANIFWRDSMMKEDYEIYGDVMVFDTTYITNRLYTFKEKWCTALNKGYFSAGFRSSQRSESTNHSIGFNADQNTSLTDFYGIFKNTIKRWRRVEQQDEFNCSRARPDSYFEIAGMHDTTTVYTVTSSKEECCGQVIFDSGLNLITCSCMKFEVDEFFSSILFKEYQRLA